MAKTTAKTTAQTTAKTLEDTLDLYRVRVEAALDRQLPTADTSPARLHEAMRYSVLGGGKRIRAMFVYASGEALGVPLEHLDAPAGAVEIIHAYSLVHDDLPAMDDDDLRRGVPTCHRAFDEATAILTGDSLQTLAFEVIVRDPHLPDPPKLRMVEILARASGSLGMAGGQAIDLESVGKQVSLDTLEDMYQRKTGSLLRASVLLGALSCPALEDPQREALSDFGKHIGLAFQIKDDLLDIQMDTATLGKPQGSDQARNKPTWPELLGLEKAEETANQLCRAAVDSLAALGHNAHALRELAKLIVQRQK